MTRLKADELVALTWIWLAANPGIGKPDLPEEITDKIISFPYRCPWCALYEKHDCVGCPMNSAYGSCFMGDPKHPVTVHERLTQSGRPIDVKNKPRAQEAALKVVSVALDDMHKLRMAK
jgi:hypothetical protein